MVGSHVSRRRYSRRRFSRWSWLAAAIVCIIAGRWTVEHFDQHAATRWVLPEEGIHRVTRIDEGPVLFIFAAATDRQGNRREGLAEVTLLGVAVPEETQAAQEAVRWLKDLTDERPIRLQYDTRRFDRQGRLVAYVYVGDTFVNAELIRSGLARSDTRIGDSSSQARILEKAEAEFNAKRGAELR